MHETDWGTVFLLLGLSVIVMAWSLIDAAIERGLLDGAMACLGL